jgi:GH25 family lysozyme M1 (1,4-beta-N-acetylmuramidase)
MELGSGVKVSHADTYPHTPYGWAWANGKNVATTGLTDYNQQALTGTQRRVRGDIANATRRADATTNSAVAGDPLAPNEVGNFTGWKHGQDVNQSGVHTDVWFQGISGNWFWAGSFTDQGTHDLKDLNPVAPTDPKVRVVLSSAPANKRTQPTSTSSSPGEAAAGSKITMTGFAVGQTVNGINVWFTDGTVWYWSGGFTSQSTASLTDLSSTVSPPPAQIVPTSYGIDINGDKLGIDFAKAKADGVQFVIVKAGGHNTSKQTISSEYPTLIDGARAQSLPVGHYFVTGVGDPDDEAEFFVKNLHGYNVETDILALDNELFNKGPNGDQNVNTAFWEDDQVTAFFTRVHELTGHPYSRMWHYTNDVERTKHDWTKSNALGVRPWVAGYGSNPADQTPQAKPVSKDWYVAQFSSAQKLDAYNGLLDGNWSEHSVEELFAKGEVGTPNTPGDGGNTDPGDGGTTNPPTDDGNTPPNWFVSFLNAIINAIKSWLGVKSS